MAPTIVSPAVRDCPAKSAKDYYFPSNTFLREGMRDDVFVREWYSRHLAAAKQVSLSCGTGSRSYRFTWLRSFGHPVVVHATVQGQTVKLAATELAGAGGYEPKATLREVDKSLTLADADSLRASIDAIGEEPASLDRIVLDGAEWIVEMRDGDRYRVLVRTSPKDGPVRALGLNFLRLTGWNYPDDQIY